MSGHAMCKYGTKPLVVLSILSGKEWCVCVMKRGWCKCETHLGEGSHSEGSGVAQHLPPRTSPMKNNSVSVLLAVSI